MLTFTGATIRPADAATLEQGGVPPTSRSSTRWTAPTVARSSTGSCSTAGEVSIRFTDVAILRKPAVDRRAV